MRLVRHHRPGPYIPFITLADIAWQIIIFFLVVEPNGLARLWLIAKDIDELLFEFVAHFDKVIEIDLQVEQSAKITGGGFDASRVITLNIGRDFSDDIEHANAFFGPFDGFDHERVIGELMLLEASGAVKVR